MWRPLSLLLWSAILAMLGWVAVPLASASTGICANESLRSELHSGQLPDCRAYELASPAYKEGAFISSAYAVSRDGSRFIGGSIGVFAGAEEDIALTDGSVAGVAYEFSRSDGTGWAPTSLAPPASTYVSDGMVDASAELESSLWELAQPQPEGVESLYREQPVGTFTEVGPATPSPTSVNKRMYDYLGASADLSHVLFSVLPGLRWPFDGTVVSSGGIGEGGGTLYEYVGVEQPGESREPSLVGVNGGDGSSALISRCGTRLGSSSPEEEVRGSMYNSISAGGERIFFTAVGADDHACGAEQPPVDELFVREELSPTESRTIPISEPEVSYCSPPPPASPPLCADAHFEGASLDGSKVFFTTEQELVPGAKGMNLYEYDFGQPPDERVTLVSDGADPEVQGVARISQDGSHVYFVAKGKLTGTPNGLGKQALVGADNLYVYERDEQFPSGRMSFVATLSPGDSSDWAREDERPVIASKDGGLLVFVSVADVTNEGLGDEKPQVFQYNAATGGLVRASIGQDGYNDDGRAPVAGSSISIHFPSAYSYTHTDSPTLANGIQAAGDGAVFFQSADALTPQALNDQFDSLDRLIPNVYEYRAGNVYLLSDGRDTSTVNAGPGTYLAGSDSSGENVFFFTSDALIPQDGDTQQDLYDARMGGGSSPSPTPAAACTGEACLGILAGAPALAPLGGSATQTTEARHSPSNPTPAKIKAKKKAKKKTKAKAKKGANKTALSARSHRKRS